MAKVKILDDIPEFTFSQIPVGSVFRFHEDIKEDIGYLIYIKMDNNSLWSFHDEEVIPHEEISFSNFLVELVDIEIRN